MKTSELQVSLSALCCAIAMLASCKKAEDPSTDGSHLVVATTTMVADLVRVVGGDDVTLVALMKPQVDPHMYKATAADVAKLNRAKAIFYSGLLLEGRMQDIFKRMKEQGKRVFAVTDAIPSDQRIEPEDASGHPDPHVWGDVLLWSSAIDVVQSGLSEAFPDKQTSFAQRAANYREELKKLHAWCQQQIASIPESRRKLVTSHDAFAYFGRAYGLEVIGVQGISTASDASVADRTRMVDFIKQHQIPSIFVESSVSRVLIDQISKDANVTVGGELFSDAMGEPGKLETANGKSFYDVGTYPGMIKHNVNTIVKALQK